MVNKNIAISYNFSTLRITMLYFFASIIKYNLENSMGDGKSIAFAHINSLYTLLLLLLLQDLFLTDCLDQS